MLQLQTIDAIRKIAKEDKAVEAALTVFAARERARSQVTVRALTQRMQGEGWTEFNEDDAKRVIKLLAQHGVGKLQKDSSGRITAVTEIRVTLQSLGQAVIGHVKHALELYKPRNKYTPVKAPAPQKKPKAPAPVAETVTMPAHVSPHPLRRASDGAAASAESITVLRNGKPVIVHVPEDFTAQEIAEFLVSLRSWNRKSVTSGNDAGKK